MKILREHIIFIIGFIWLLIALSANLMIITMKLQYDDGGLGTILMLGKPIYAFPFWILSELMMPLKINNYLWPYLLGLLLFIVLDLIVYKVRRKKKSRAKETR